MGLFSVLGPGIALFGANAQKKAAQRAASQVAEAANRFGRDIETANKPMADTLDWSLPAYKSAGVNLFGSKVGKDSAIIRGKSEESAKNIEDERLRQLAASNLFHSQSGNIGRGRGEALRIGQTATDATNRLNLDTGEAQEAYRDTNAKNYTGWLGGMVDFGKQAIGNLIEAGRARFGGQTQAAGINANASSQYAADIGGIAGDLWGQETAKSDRKWLTGMYKKMGLFRN